MIIDTSKLIVKELDKLILPAGVYYATDPCYIYKSDEMDKLKEEDFDRRVGFENECKSDKSLDYWLDFCNKIHPFDIAKKSSNYINYSRSQNGTIFEYDNIPFFVWGTAYGDGSYPVTEDLMTLGYAGVDTGLLSIFPQKLVDLLENGAETKKLLEDRLIVKIELEDDFEIICGEGNASFGGFTVNTSGYEDENEDNGYSEEDFF